MWPRRGGRRDRVAPLAGAWIETGEFLGRNAKIKVAPLAGAWIETDFAALRSANKSVAPLAGAWIETEEHLTASGLTASRPSRARGLKLECLCGTHH